MYEVKSGLVSNVSDTYSSKALRPECDYMSVGCGGPTLMLANLSRFTKEPYDLNLADL